MSKQLNMYKNVELNPIEIKDFSIVEIYKDKVEKINSLGYFIQPLEGLSAKQIEDKIKERAKAVKPEGYTNSKLMAGREGNHFNQKRVYLVWYKDKEPIYPAEPKVEPSLSAAAAYEDFQTIKLDYEGIPADLELTFEATNSFIFYINGEKFSVVIDSPKKENTVIVNKKGAFMNEVPIDSFSFEKSPQLKCGKNEIKVQKGVVTNVSLKYEEKF